MVEILVYSLLDIQRASEFVLHPVQFLGFQREKVVQAKLAPQQIDENPGVPGNTVRVENSNFQHSELCLVGGDRRNDHRPNIRKHVSSEPAILRVALDYQFARAECMCGGRTAICGISLPFPLRDLLLTPLLPPLSVGRCNVEFLGFLVLQTDAKGSFLGIGLRQEPVQRFAARWAPACAVLRGPAR